MRRGGGAQSCEARWQDRRVVSHLHIADVGFLLISTRIAGVPLKQDGYENISPRLLSRSRSCREEVCAPPRIAALRHVC